MQRPVRLAFAMSFACFGTLAGCSAFFEQRGEPYAAHDPAGSAFFTRHSTEYRVAAAFRAAHAKTHDGVLRGSLARAERKDHELAADLLAPLFDPPRIETPLAYNASYTAQSAFRYARVVDFTHVFRRQTFDILASERVPWDAKAVALRRAVESYLGRLDDALSPAPVELTLRRAGVLQKPYFDLFRTHYPRTSALFRVESWWQAAIHEAVLWSGGNGFPQDEAVRAAHGRLYDATRDRPARLLLAREMMPRFSRLSPEAANILDQLVFLQALADAVFAYERWSVDERRVEVYRLVDAFAHQPGDAELATRVPLPRPDVDPRRYEPWMHAADGEETRIYAAMLEDTWGSWGSGEAPPESARELLRQKLTAGVEPGEPPGSLVEALATAVGVRSAPDALGPGVTPPGAAESAKAWADAARMRPPFEAVPAEPPRAEAPSTGAAQADETSAPNQGGERDPKGDPTPGPNTDDAARTPAQRASDAAPNGANEPKKKRRREEKRP
jgi:hypothetical protein